MEENMNIYKIPFIYKILEDVGNFNTKTR